MNLKFSYGPCSLAVIIGAAIDALQADRLASGYSPALVAVATTSAIVATRSLTRFRLSRHVGCLTQSRRYLNPTRG